MTDTTSELIDNPIHSNTVNGPGCHDLEATPNIVSQVSFPAIQGRSDTCMDGRIADQALLMSQMQECSMVHSASIESGSLHGQTFSASLLTHNVIYPHLESISGD